MNVDLIAACLVAASAVSGAAASNAQSDRSPTYGVTLPEGYRCWELIGVTRRRAPWMNCAPRRPESLSGGMSSLDLAGDAVDFVAAAMGAAVGIVEHAVFVPDLNDRPTPANGIDFSKHVTSGRAAARPFAAISAVEGLKLTPAGRKWAGGSASAQRRADVLKAYAETRWRWAATTPSTPKGDEVGDLGPEVLALADEGVAHRSGQ